MKRNYNLHQYYLDVNIEDVGSFDETLADKLYKQPTEHLAIFEEAATEVVDELTAPRPSGEEKVEDIQITFNSDSHASNLRALKVGLTVSLLLSSVMENFSLMLCPAWLKYLGLLSVPQALRPKLQKFRSSVGLAVISFLICRSKRDWKVMLCLGNVLRK